MVHDRLNVCGDDLITFQTDGPRQAQQFASRLREGDWLEVVPGIDSVVVRFDAARLRVAEAVDALDAALEAPADVDTAPAPLVDVPVTYGGAGGPDLDALLDSLGLDSEAFIAMHTAGEYHVEMLGFTPGFAYIGGLDDRLDVPRLDEPRRHVAAGSVGIAGRRTGIYALPGPGGWPLIGRTTLTLFDPDAEEPFLLKPGMRIRFVAAGDEDT